MEKRKKDKHEHGVGFLAHMDIVNTVMGFRPYAPTKDCDDNEIEEFYDQLQNVIGRTTKKDVLVVQGAWNAKVGKDACGNWQDICGPFRNDDTNERGLRLQ